MVLPEIAKLCDAVELAALGTNAQLSITDLGRRFYPDVDIFAEGEESSANVQIKEALALARLRSQACGGSYPFEVTQRSIKAQPVGVEFNVYLFLLLGLSLKACGGISDRGALIKSFERYFEDVVCLALRQGGFAAEVLSIPREFRGVPKSLIPALKEISVRFGGFGDLDETKVLPDDNDLDTDIVVAAARGNMQRSGWPAILVQCATGDIATLQSKMEEGSATFSRVWKTGFRQFIRTVSTPYDLLKLHDVHWDRLSEAGWVLDRTRLVHLANGTAAATLPSEAKAFWTSLLDFRNDIAWQAGFSSGGDN